MQEVGLHWWGAHAQLVLENVTPLLRSEHHTSASKFSLDSNIVVLDLWVSYSKTYPEQVLQQAFGGDLHALIGKAADSYRPYPSEAVNSVGVFGGLSWHGQG
jgi:hypothetical protein